MEKSNHRSKGVIELNWKILVAIIAAVITFIIIYLVLAGILSGENLGRAGREFCLLLLSKLKIFGLGAEQAGICDVFIKA